MSSQEDKKCDCVFSSEGVNIFGYMVPWWVVVVVLLLVVYVLHDQGVLTNVFPAPLRTIGIETNVAAPVSLPALDETPTEIKRLLEGFKF